MLECLKITPFGRPVVPLVYINAKIASGSYLMSGQESFCPSRGSLSSTNIHEIRVLGVGKEECRTSPRGHASAST